VEFIFRNKIFRILYSYGNQNPLSLVTCCGSLNFNFQELYLHSFTDYAQKKKKKSVLNPWYTCYS